MVRAVDLLRFSALLLVLVIVPSTLAQPADTRIAVSMAGLFPLSGVFAKTGAEIEAVTRAGIEFFINPDFATFPRLKVNFVPRDTESSPIGGVRAFQEGVDSVGTYIGPFLSEVAEFVGTTSAIYEYAVLSYASTKASLSDDERFPFFNRVVPPEDRQGEAVAALVDFYSWHPFTAVLYTSDEYGVSLFERYEKEAADRDITILTQQPFQNDQDDVDVELEAIRQSLARVVVIFAQTNNYRTIVRSARRLGMLEDDYVFICSDRGATDEAWTDVRDGSIDEATREGMRGWIGTQFHPPQGALYEQFLDVWETLDPLEYPGAGTRKVNRWAPFAIDAFSLTLRGFSFNFVNAVLVLRQGIVNPIDQSALQNLLRNIVFEGMTGVVNLHGTKDRSQYPFDIVNLRDDEDDWVVVGQWVDLPDDYGRYDDFDYLVGNPVLEEPEPGLHMRYKISFIGGSEKLPDLFVRNSLDYWSCDDRKEKTDKSGKRVRLEEPGGNDPNNIAEFYRCDQFIDCDNMSDEWGCTPSLPVAMIIYGIFVFLLVLIALFFMAFTCVFGFCVKKKRVRAASPVFLIIALVACICGFLAVFAWYGKPHPVACAFQPWLVTVPLIVLVSALFVKSFRVWRLYRSQHAIKAIPDLHLVVAIVLLSLPVIFINFLWSLLATPTASLEDRDGHEHYVCNTGGFLGEPFGIVFAALLIAYFAAVLLFGVFLSFVTRNVSSAFNESRLIGVSIYNLTFLGVVVIPVYFALQAAGPVAVWVIVATAILYGFAATMFVQFVPKVWGVLLVDGLKGDTYTDDTTVDASATAESIKSSDAMF